MIAGSEPEDTLKAGVRVACAVARREVVMRTSGMLILALLLAVPTARAQSSRDPGESHKAIKVIVGASALAIGTVIVAKSSNSTTVTSPLASSETSSFSSSQLVTGLVVAGV